jgi:uncharacterized membrane protein
MDANIMEWSQLLFRWLHVIAGVMWIGHLWFFNFVNAQLAKTYDADSKKKVVPELMPRALYWFRWGAAWTWITGFMLLGFVYYMGGVLLPSENAVVGVGAGSAIGVALLIVGFGVYDMLWKSGLGKNETTAGAISFVLTVAVAFGLNRIFSGRAMFIHIGALFGTAMAANVWMRIWPAQRKIITAIKEGKAPDAALAGLAGLRSKHNTYMSVPLLLLMVSNHYPGAYGSDFAWIFVAAFVAVGWGGTKLMYNKSASDVTKKYELTQGGGSAAA